MSQSVIKKIDSSQLKVGMYIHDLSCDWLSHPFARSRFLLSSEQEIRKILNAGIHDVYIDTGKGLDVADAPTVEEVERQIEHELISIAQQSPLIVPKTSFAEELDRAKSIRNQAKQQVMAMMHDARLGKAIELDKVEPVVQEITESILRNSGALIGLLRIKSSDDYTFLHSVSVCALLVAFCRSTGMDSALIQQAGIGGLLHDTGKALTPDYVLNKPGRLTDEEFDIMKRHPKDGYDILVKMPEIGNIPLDITLHHHERMDGSGYPDKLPGDQISTMAQMAAIVDVYDAITSDRVYHKGMTAADALRRIFEWSKHHFNPQHVHAFIRCVGIYPVGTLVQMESGHLAVVMEPHENNLLAPTIKLFFNTKTNSYITPKIVDLSKPLGAGGADRILGHEAAEKWQVEPMRFLDLA
ncbi:MAG: hypothetical protein H6R04_189 [Burkholderiaceae bacterium]|nr:hypothetical protein [Burkholderiaceae bacterium]